MFRTWRHTAKIYTRIKLTCLCTALQLCNTERSVLAPPFISVRLVFIRGGVHCSSTISWPLYRYQIPVIWSGSLLFPYENPRLTPYLTEIVTVLLAEYVQDGKQCSRAFAFGLKEARMACIVQLGAVSHDSSLQDDSNSFNREPF